MADIIASNTMKALLDVLFFFTSVGMNLKQMWVHGVKSPEKKNVSAPGKNAPSLLLLLSSTPLTF